MKPSSTVLTFRAVLLAGAATLAMSSRASAATTCSIDFGNYSALKALPDNAAGNTFAVAPFYTHPCTGGSFTLSEGPGSNYGHYHLSFENACINCFASNGYFGLNRSCAGTGTGCDVIDPASYPRYVQGHQSDMQFQLVGQPNPGTWCAGDGCLSTIGRVYRPLSIFARDATPMKVTVMTFRLIPISTPSGWITIPVKSAVVYDNLTGPAFWTIGNNQVYTDQILMTKATNSTSGSVISFDNILIVQ